MMPAANEPRILLRRVSQLYFAGMGILRFYEAACCIRLLFLKTANTLTALNNLHVKYLTGQFGKIISYH
jgi:hypothetical protein